MWYFPHEAREIFAARINQFAINHLCFVDINFKTNTLTFNIDATPEFLTDLNNCLLEMEALNYEEKPRCTFH